MKRRRILHLIASNFVGGPEKQILYHAEHLQNSAYEVLIGSFRDGTDTPEILAAAASVGHPTVCLPGGTHRNLVRDLSASLSSNGVDLLCTHGYKANLVGHWAARRCGLPHVAFVRGWTGETWKVQLYEAIERCVLRRVEHVVCVSRAQADRLNRQTYGRKAAIVIPNSILPPYLSNASPANLTRAALSIPPDAFVFGALGRLSKEKGHSVLLKAFHLLRAAEPDRPMLLLLLGEGREQPALQELARRLGIEEQVQFAGFQRNASAWMRLMDCLVQPSLTEGTPNSVLEALHIGLPIVATAVGGVPDVIRNGLNGLLVAPGDPRSLCDALKIVLTSNAVRERLAHGAQHCAEEYGVNKQQESLTSLYEEILRASSPAVVVGA